MEVKFASSKIETKIFGDEIPKIRAVARYGDYEE
jgi:hypothetical protein